MVLSDLGNLTWFLCCDFNPFFVFGVYIIWRRRVVRLRERHFGCSRLLGEERNLLELGDRSLLASVEVLRSRIDM